MPQPKLPSWSIEGVCTEARPLVSKKDNKIWAYMIKIMAMGGVFELTTRDEALFKHFGEGGIFSCTGTFGQFQGAVRFELTGVKAAT